MEIDPETEKPNIQTPPNRMSDLILPWLAAIAVGVLALLIIGSCIFSVWAGIGGTTSYCYAGKPDTSIEDLAKFKFPSTAQHIKCSSGGQQGWATSATFEMAPDDLETFQASTPIQHWRSGDIKAGGTSTPKSKYLHGEYHEAFFDQDIVIDMSDPVLYKVHIEVSGGD